MKRKKVVIIGSGPAGYTAALYAARANLEPLVFEGFMAGLQGGQLMTTTDVENFPGFPEGILGPDLVTAFRRQALRFGSEMLGEDVESVDVSRSPLIVRGSQTQVETLSLIIATGAMAKRLDIEGTRDGEFWQKGVTACAVCDGAAPIFRNRPLFVVGGGDSAMEEALFLTKYASRVYILHRRNQFRASKVMVDRVLQHPKIEVIWNARVRKVSGDRVVNRILIEVEGKLEEREAGGLFLRLGMCLIQPF
jgi:thioredoxin reductase (NADPH)